MTQKRRLSAVTAAVAAEMLEGEKSSRSNIVGAVVREREREPPNSRVRMFKIDYIFN